MCSLVGEISVASLKWWFLLRRFFTGTQHPVANRQREAMEDDLWEQVERKADKVAIGEEARHRPAVLGAFFSVDLLHLLECVIRLAQIH